MLSFFMAKAAWQSAADETRQGKNTIFVNRHRKFPFLWAPNVFFCVQGIGIDDLLQLSAEFVQQIISKQAGQERGSVIDILPSGPNFLWLAWRFLRRTWTDGLLLLFASKTTSEKLSNGTTSELSSRAQRPPVPRSRIWEAFSDSTCDGFLCFWVMNEHAAHLLPKWKRNEKTIFNNSRKRFSSLTKSRRVIDALKDQRKRKREIRKFKSNKQSSIN